MTKRSDIAARVLTVVAAMFFVAAFALAALLPPMLTAGEFLAMIDHRGLVNAEGFVRGHVSDWAWLRVVLPLLLRPAWLLPTALGMVAAGAALTARSRQGEHRSRRRRS